MGLLSGFRDGLTFASDMLFRHQGAYTCVPERPAVCDKCHSDSGCFHAHGRYKRWLLTVQEAGVDSDSSLETPLVVPFLRANDEYRAT